MRQQMIDAQQTYAADPTAANRAMMIEAQRAYEAERRQDAEAARRVERDEECAQYRAELIDRLARAPDELPSTPIGVVSRKHAEWLGMAASVAGGAVLTDTHASQGLTDMCGDGCALRYVGVGAIGGEPVWDLRPLNRAQVAQVLRGEVARLADSPSLLSLRDEVDAIVGMLDMVETL